MPETAVVMGTGELTIQPIKINNLYSNHMATQLEIEEKENQIDRKKIGDRLMAILLLKKIEIIYLVAVTGITKSAYSMIINATRSINSQNLKRTLKAIQIKREDFFKELDDDIVCGSQKIDLPEKEFLKLISQWIHDFHEDYKTMTILYRNERYLHSLGFLQSCLIKILVALYVKTKKARPSIPYYPYYILDEIDIEMAIKYKDYFRKIEKKIINQSLSKEVLTDLVENAKDLIDWIKEKLE